METEQWSRERYAQIARKAAAEGCVLLEHQEKTLPIRKGDKTAVFGRSVFHYYKSGLGSGGLVNAPYVVGILDALKKEKDLLLDEELIAIYQAWIAKHPYEEGEGWGKVPWSQKEMPLTDEMKQHAKQADVSIVVIGRTAGEDQDTRDEEGSFCLSQTEEELICGVVQNCRRTVVVLNTGNCMDMSWVKKYDPQAVLLVWQGGQEGGNAVADVLMGRVNPCGHLTDTIAQKITDWPSHVNFGSTEENRYEEDIYVGYRYFETFAPEKVLYPFGYGLSYTSFELSAEARLAKGERDGIENGIEIEATVCNTGSYPGKEVVQVYVKMPMGKLGNPLRKLAAFQKTRLLAPGETQKLTILVSPQVLTAYDDSGVTGAAFCYVMEEGVYEFYVGNDVRSAARTAGFYQKFTIWERLSQAMAPRQSLKRMIPLKEGERYLPQWEEAPRQEKDRQKKENQESLTEILFRGDQRITLPDVWEKKSTMEEFLSQLTVQDMICMFRGEGMCSPLVTPGTAGAFGGVSETLRSRKIPVGCCADGPSGIRMDCGTKAFSLPNGTALGCTFDPELVRSLYEMLGMELRMHQIDSLLGPGINIHRYPLNGRNFEYISEDPFLTGKIGAAQIAGMLKYEIGSTIKHFCANNQERGRRFSNSVVSERALREIYLKGFEMAVKEGGCRSVMTSYGAVNGIWTAGNYDLCTQILRKEWKFEGIVMTDWWAEANYEGQQSDRKAKAPMIAAQNDLYMCVNEPETNPEQDDAEEKWREGFLTTAQLQRNTQNILTYLMKSPAMLRLMGKLPKEETKKTEKRQLTQEQEKELKYYRADLAANEVIIPPQDLHPRGEHSDTFGIQVAKTGQYTLHLRLRSELSSLAQSSISVFYDNRFRTTLSVRGTEGEEIEINYDMGVFFGHNHYIRLYYKTNGLEILSASLRLEQEITMEEMMKRKRD